MVYVIISLILVILNPIIVIADDSWFNVDLSWVRTEREVIRAKYEKLLGDLPSKETQDKFLPQYKEEKFWKEYDRVRSEILSRRKLLVGVFQEMQGEVILPKAEELFVQGFNTLFMFWDGAGYNLRNGTSRYPQFWETCCSVFIYYILQDLGARFPQSVESKPFKYKAVPVWQASPEEVLCSYNYMWKNFADFGKTAKEMWGDKSIKCFETIKPDKAIPNRIVSHMNGEEAKNKFYLGGRRDHVYIVTQDLENGSGMSVFHALGVVEKFSIRRQAIVSSSDLIFLLPLTKNFYRQWLSDALPKK